MSKMTKKTGGPYMQQAGRGNMKKTGRGVPVELMGPAMHEPGHDDPIKINRKNPGQNIQRGSNSYQPQHDSGTDPRAETPLIGPTPQRNLDTGDILTYRFNSASTASTSLDQMGVRQTQTVTPESRLKSIDNVKNNKPLPQRTHAIGKRVYNQDGSLVTNVSGNSSLARAAINAGQNPSNIDQNKMFNTVETNLRKNGTRLSPGTLASNSDRFINMQFDQHKQDSTSTSDYNRIKRANDLKASKTPKFR